MSAVSLANGSPGTDQTSHARPGYRTRRAIGVLTGAGALVAAMKPFMARAANTTLPVPASLREAARAAVARREPLVVLVSLPGCPYCELVRRNYLLPMRGEGLQAVQLSITDRATPVAGFDGRPSTGAELAKAWKADFTPTILFFDGQGTEIADRLVGVASPDFFGSYLDDALSAARKKLAARP